MIEKDAGELGKRDGEEREVDAGDAEAKAEGGDDDAGEARDRHPREDAEPRRDPVMDEERRRRIAAEPDIERVADGEQPRISHHDVPGLAQVWWEQHQP